MNVLLVNPNRIQPPVAPLALDYLTTAGTWIPEIAIFLRSIPALVTSGGSALKPRVTLRRSEGDTFAESLRLPSSREPGDAGGNG